MYLKILIENHDFLAVESFEIWMLYLKLLREKDCSIAITLSFSLGPKRFFEKINPEVAPQKNVVYRWLTLVGS